MIRWLFSWLSKTVCNKIWLQLLIRFVVHFYHLFIIKKPSLLFRDFIVLTEKGVFGYWCHDLGTYVALGIIALLLVYHLRRRRHHRRCRRHRRHLSLSLSLSSSFSIFFACFEMRQNSSRLSPYSLCFCSCFSPCFSPCYIFFCPCFSPCFSSCFSPCFSPCSRPCFSPCFRFFCSCSRPCFSPFFVFILVVIPFSTLSVQKGLFLFFRPFSDFPPFVFLAECLSSVFLLFFFCLSSVLKSLALNVLWTWDALTTFAARSANGRVVSF